MDDDCSSANAMCALRCSTVSTVGEGRSRSSQQPTPRRLVALVSVAAFGLGACAMTDVAIDVTALRADEVASSNPVVDDTAVDPDPSETPPPPPPSAPVSDQPDPTVDTGVPTPIPDEVPPIDDLIDTDVPDLADGDAPLSDDEVDEIIGELVEAGFCEPTDFEDEGAVTAIHFVVQGRLQSPCYVAQPDSDVGDVVFDDDPRLIAAWNELVAVTPIELVDDISLLAGYEACADCDTLAYVTTLDVDAEFFVIAVDVVAAVTDPEELRLTMLHELSHVFTQRPGEQLTIQPESMPCATFFNGVGCFTDESYMWAWIQEFWPPEIRDDLPADGSVGSDDEAFERCDADAAFTGSYAAVHPEEDFAETFSAYVYDVEVDPALDAKLAFFDRYPEFVEVRTNALAAGLGDTEGNFEGCGI